MNTVKKKHIIELDYLRTFAFIAVIAQHVLGFYQRNSIFTPLDNYIVGFTFGIVKFAVPLFVFLSGIVLFHHYYPRFNYKSFLIKRFITIFIPFLLWSVFYILEPFNTIPTINLPWLKSFLLNLLYGSSKYHLWYVSMIIQGFILLPIVFYIFKIVQKKVTSTSTFIVVFFVFTTTYVLYIQNYLLITQHLFFSNFFYMMYSRGFISYLFYFIFGGIVALNYETFVILIKKFKFPIIMITLISYFYIEYYGFHNSEKTINLNLFGSLNLRFLIFTVFFILTLYLVSLGVSESYKTPKIITIISNYSFPAYLAHAFVLTKTYQFFLTFSMNILLFYSLVFITTCIASILLGILFQVCYDQLIHFKLK